MGGTVGAVVALAAVLPCQAGADDLERYYVRGRANGAAFTVTVTAPAGRPPEFLPVPIRGGDSPFAYEARVRRTATRSFEVNIVPTDRTEGAAVGTLTVSKNGDASVLQGRIVPDATASFEVTVVSDSGAITATFEGDHEGPLLFGFPVPASGRYRLTVRASGGSVETSVQETAVPREVPEPGAGMGVAAVSGLGNFLSVAGADIDPTAAGGIAFSLRVSPYGVYLTFQTRVLSSVVVGWQEVTEQPCGPAGLGPAAGDDTIEGGAGGGGGEDCLPAEAVIARSVRLEVWLTDVSISWSWGIGRHVSVEFQIGLARFHGDVSGDRTAGTAAAALSVRGAGTAFSIGYSLVSVAGKLGFDGTPATAEGFGAWTVAWSVAF